MEAVAYPFRSGAASWTVDALGGEMVTPVSRAATSSTPHSLLALHSHKIQNTGKTCVSSEALLIFLPVHSKLLTQ